MNKRCIVCGEVKPLEDFNRQLLGKYGLNGRCKICHRANAREYYAKNSKHLNAQAKVTKLNKLLDKTA
jgi:hypothetical protein